MPKETFGGGDGGGSQPERKKPSLGKFGLMPDTNIRDVFWRLMASYAATKKPGTDLKALGHDRIALVKVALSVLSGPQAAQYGLTPKFIIAYTEMMLLDGAWEDALAEFLIAGRAAMPGLSHDIACELDRLYPNEAYAAVLTGCLTSMLRNKETSAVALHYVAGIGNEKLSMALKTELLIFARGDVGENQKNAMQGLEIIRDDPEVRKALVGLLSHWDAEARLAAAKALSAMGGDEEVRKAAEKRLVDESDAKVREALRRILP